MKYLITTIAAVVLVGFSVQQQSAIAQQSSVSEPVAETANPESVDLKNNGSNKIVMNGVKFVAIMFGWAGLLYFFFKFKIYETRGGTSD